MSTTRLYYEDAYRREFTAQVLDCIPKPDGSFWVELDCTCFYPEGGGQPGDTGLLGEVAVRDTREKDGRLFHVAGQPLTAGQTVQGRIDWARRFMLMQHHTAEHIVSGLMHKRHKRNNVGFHMGGAMVTMDFDGPLAPDDIAAVELAANRVVFENIPIEVSYPAPDALAKMEYRSKKALEGQVRIVTVPGADRCACCGTHLARTGEIGLIKLVQPQHYKGGIRVGLLCGLQALADHREKEAQVTAVSRLLSAKPAEAAQAVQRLHDEAEQLRGALAAAKTALFDVQAAAAPCDGHPLVWLRSELSPNDLRLLVTALAAHRPGLCAVFAGEGGAQGYRYALAQQGQDARALATAMHQALGGKGGGKPALTQGNVTAGLPEIAAYFGVQVGQG